MKKLFLKALLLYRYIVDYLYKDRVIIGISGVSLGMEKQVSLILKSFLSGSSFRQMIDINSSKNFFPSSTPWGFRTDIVKKWIYLLIAGPILDLKVSSRIGFAKNFFKINYTLKKTLDLMMSLDMAHQDLKL